ncbi:MAG: G5 domain-containing protein [Acutalibacteraceae bacterium]|jgi:hypothetical protein
MEQIKRITTGIKRIAGHRGFAVSVLSAFSVAVMGLASITAQAVAGMPNDRVVLSMQNSAYVVQAASPAQAWDSQEGFDVRIVADGSRTLLRVAEGTVADALETVGVAVGEDDILSVRPDEKLTPDMEIVVQRVTFREYTETEVVPFKTEVSYDATMLKGTSKTVREGVNGEKTNTYRDRLVDGEVVENDRIASTVTKQPVSAQRVEGTFTPPTTRGSGTVKPGSYSEDDLYCLAVAIYREAGSDWLTDEHRALVGCVVMNRVRSPLFANTVRGVLMSPGQYQGLSSGVYFPAGVSESSPAVQRAYRVAREVLEGQWSCPENVVFQAGFPQGSGTYRTIYAYGTVTYFCYR